MHSRMIPLVAGLFAIAASPVFVPTPGLAQGNPSADQIIKSLTPTGDVSKQGTRGIRMAPSGDTAPARSAVTPSAMAPSASAPSAIAPSAVAPSASAPPRSISHPTMAAAKPSAAAPAQRQTPCPTPALPGACHATSPTRLLLLVVNSDQHTDKFAC